jgi:hypothetical protein
MRDRRRIAGAAVLERRPEYVPLYDRPKYVTPAVAKLKEFFDEALK